MITKTIAVSEKSEKKTNLISWILSAALHISVFVLFSVMKLMQPEIIEYEPLLEVVEDSPGSQGSSADNAAGSSSSSFTASNLNPLTAPMIRTVSAPQKATSFYLSTILPVIRTDVSDSEITATEEIVETRQPDPDIKPVDADIETAEENITEELLEVPDIIETPMVVIETEQENIAQVEIPVEPLTPEKPEDLPEQPVQEAILPEQNRVDRKEDEETEDLADQADRVENQPDPENINKDDNQNNENNNDDQNDRGNGGFGNGLQQGIGNGGQALMLPPNTTDGRILQEVTRISRFNSSDFDGELPGKGTRLEIVLSFAINPDGSLSNIVVENSSGFQGVDAKLIAALNDFSFPSADNNSNGSITFIIQYLR